MREKRMQLGGVRHDKTDGLRLLHGHPASFEERLQKRERDAVSVAESEEIKILKMLLVDLAQSQRLKPRLLGDNENQPELVHDHRPCRISSSDPDTAEANRGNLVTSFLSPSLADKDLRLNPFGTPIRVPSIRGILRSAAPLPLGEQTADLVFAPPVAEHKLLDWHSLDKLVEISYRSAVETIASWAGPVAAA